MLVIKKCIKIFIIKNSPGNPLGPGVPVAPMGPAFEEKIKLETFIKLKLQLLLLRHLHFHHLFQAIQYFRSSLEGQLDLVDPVINTRYQLFENINFKTLTASPGSPRIPKFQLF